MSYDIMKLKGEKIMEVKSKQVLSDSEAKFLADIYNKLKTKKLIDEKHITFNMFINFYDVQDPFKFIEKLKKIVNKND